MIRFCDREVGCVEYESLSRGELLGYFLEEGHINDIIIVYDSFDTMVYMGKITYHSLLYAINISSAIQNEYVVLDQNIWKNAREYFDRKDKRDEVDLLLPVLNNEYRLICFAYEDSDANREIRMLRELSEEPKAVQFADLYPEYQCVKIHEFNELAYFFAKYLRDQSVMVQVDGALWQYFFIGDECEVPDYACFIIYAEGIAQKKHDFAENILRSVSVEFECIDQIYETNIKNTVFQNANGNWKELAERLRGEKEVVILGTDIEAQKAYGFLKKNGIDACCFMDSKSHKMFGKDILTYLDIRNIYKTPIYINCQSEGSAWGWGT